MTGGKEIHISQQELLNEKKHFIQHPIQSKMLQQQQKEAQQTKQQCQQECKELNIDMEATARQRRMESDTKEYNLLVKKVKDESSELTLENFLELVK
jgi:hypothetical protein